MNSGKADGERIAQLERALSQANAENQSLMKKIKEAETKQVQIWRSYLKPIALILFQMFLVLVNECLCSSTLGPRSLLSALSPHLVGPRPSKYFKNKFMNKARLYSRPN